jgi:YceI-like domain
MWSSRTGKAMATLLCAVLAAGAAYAGNGPETASRITLAEASRLTLKGKSTMHDFASTATRMQLALELTDTLPPGDSVVARLAAPGAVKSIVLTIPVEGMKSEKDGLDKNMYKALKAAENPNIVFRLTSPAIASGADGAAFRVSGELELAGKSQPIEVDVRASESPEGIVLEGSKALLMSDFGIKPPTMFLGTLKTADRVVVEWRLVLTNDGF